MSRGAVLLCLFLMATGVLAQNMFQTRCGPECQNTYCYFGLGCTNCKPQYCTNFVRRVGSVCVIKCPRGYRCHTALGKKFCTKERTRG